MKTGSSYLGIGCLCAICAACASGTAKIQEVRNYQASFLCDGGQQLGVRFIPFQVVLETPDASVEMAQKPAADGYLYAGGGQSLRARGPDAVWTDGKGAVHRCREGAAASSKRNTFTH
jgi:hypothetical protein